MQNTPGIHHITAIAGDAQKNLDFYSGILGLRLVKKTVNYDDPGTYHLYYGDASGSPGSILTFFPWTSSGFRGRPGPGQVTTISFSVPTGSLGFWAQRLKSLGTDYQGPRERSDGTFIALRDPDGMSVELVDAGSPASNDAWTGRVPGASAIRGFHSAALSVRDAEATARFLTSVLGFAAADGSDGRLRFSTGAAGIGTIAEVVGSPDGPAGRMGAGAIHHIAWRAGDDALQLLLRSQVTDAGTPATAVIDRTYFHSVYFQEPGGILFEIATDPPGFTVDEPADRLGASLMLPAWLESSRAQIEKALPPLEAEAANGGEAWTQAV